MAEVGPGERQEPDRRPWWEREGLTVPPAWGLDHPGHPGHVPQPRRRRRGIPAQPTRAERRRFGI